MCCPLTLAPVIRMRQANGAFEAREKAIGEMNALKAQADKEQQGFEEEWKHLTAIIEDDKKERVGSVCVWLCETRDTVLTQTQARLVLKAVRGLWVLVVVLLLMVVAWKGVQTMGLGRRGRRECRLPQGQVCEHSAWVVSLAQAAAVQATVSPRLPTNTVRCKGTILPAQSEPDCLLPVPHRAYRYPSQHPYLHPAAPLCVAHTYTFSALSPPLCPLTDVVPVRTKGTMTRRSTHVSALLHCQLPHASPPPSCALARLHPAHTVTPLALVNKLPPVNIRRVRAPAAFHRSAPAPRSWPCASARRRSCSRWAR